MLRPILNRVVIRPDPEITKVGKIFVPDIAKADSEGYKTGSFVQDMGTIVAVGPKCIADLKPGQRVMFRKVGDGRAGVEVNVDGEDLLVMRDDDLIAIVEEKKLAARR
jgi:chaperonin GroES